MKMTIKSLRAARHKGGTDYRWDSALPGFGFRIYPSGKKAFVVSYKIHGRKRFDTLA
jgi:hypothetical protein